MQRLYDEPGAAGTPGRRGQHRRRPGDRRTSPAGRAGTSAGFAREMGLTFDIWHDPAGDIQRTYRTTGVPESFVIDRNGAIIKKVIGATEWDSDANVGSIAGCWRPEEWHRAAHLSSRTGS